jgi:hypothetical protein
MISNFPIFGVRSRAAALVLVFAILTGTVTAQVVTAVSNISNSLSVGFGISGSPLGNALVAQNFTTGSNSWTLNSVTLGLLKNNVAFTGDVTAYIYSDSGGTPAGLLASSVTTHTLPANTSINAEYTFSFSGQSLSGSTTYWVAVSGAASNAGLNWKGTSDNSQSTSVGWSIADTGPRTSSDSGSSWGSASSLGVGIFSVSATSAIPEPSTYAAICGAAVLGLAAWRRKRRAA